MRSAPRPHCLLGRCKAKPACGSGAFLISAFRRLLAERIAAARDVDRARGGIPGAIDETPLIAEILRDNIYGVDINPASVEIAKLALWLHSARAAAPLSSLERTIRIGNSLVGDDFWAGRERTPQSEERVRSFVWRAAFPEVWPAGRDGGLRHRARQSALREAAEPDEGRSGRGRVSVGGAWSDTYRVRRPAISISICRSSRRACGCSRRAGAWRTSRRAFGR